MTTTNVEGKVNIAPIGPIVDASMQSLTLRPFRDSTTCRNLLATRAGVFHVVDDVLLLAETAIGKLKTLPPLLPAEKVAGSVITSACRWYEFEVTQIDDSQDRHLMEAKVVHVGRLKDFFGWNRAKHAVLEAAILATRIHILPHEKIEQEMSIMKNMVEKTASEQERRAFDLIETYIANTIANHNKEV